MSIEVNIRGSAKIEKRIRIKDMIPGTVFNWDSRYKYNMAHNPCVRIYGDDGEYMSLRNPGVTWATEFAGVPESEILGIPKKIDLTF